MTYIHPSAVVDSKAEIHSSVQIGPYAVIGPGVKIDSDTEIYNNVTIHGNTNIGKNNTFFPYTCIGMLPQDLKYAGGNTKLNIGNGNVFRECVTINIGTEQGGGKTSVGDDCLVMAYTHIAHDCILEDKIIISNSVQLAGHSHIQKCVVISGMSGCHHFTTIGAYAFVAGLSRVTQDVPPFTIAEGNPSSVRGINSVGLKRNGFSDEDIRELKEIYYSLYKTDMPRATVMEKMNERDNLSMNVRMFIDALIAADNGKNGRAREANR